MKDIVSTSSIMYPTNCADGTLYNLSWKRLGEKLTIVQGHFDLHQHHFGRDEHNYAHWLNLQLEGGVFSLPHLMMRYDDAALSQRRDAAPLRLISWLTFSLPYALQDFVEILMTFYGNRDPEPADRLQEYLTQHCPQCSIREHPDVIRNHIVDQIRDWNQDWQPKCLLDLFEGFLARMPLHRLAHFLDMVLPQLSPMHTRWDDSRKTLLCYHFFRLARTGDLFARVRLQSSLLEGPSSTWCAFIGSGSQCFYLVIHTELTQCLSEVSMMTGL